MKRLLFLVAAIGAAFLMGANDGWYDNAKVNGPIHEGTELVVDLPTGQHVKNFGAPADGKGLCVFASMTMAARWHNVEALSDVIHKLNTGGGWPERVDSVFKQFAPNT